MCGLMNESILILSDVSTNFLNYFTKCVLDSWSEFPVFAQYMIYGTICVYSVLLLYIMIIGHYVKNSNTSNRKIVILQTVILNTMCFHLFWSIGHGIYSRKLRYIMNGRQVAYRFFVLSIVNIFMGPGNG